jgi:hypothetical protein
LAFLTVRGSPPIRTITPDPDNGFHEAVSDVLSTDVAARLHGRPTSEDEAAQIWGEAVAAASADDVALGTRKRNGGANKFNKKR